MKHIITYTLQEIEPYINWIYFYHAWSLSGKPQEEKLRMKEEALRLLHSWQDLYHTHATFTLFPANSQGDDILLFEDKEQDGDTLLSMDKGPTDNTLRMRLPMLRQQHPSKEGKPNLCLADYIRPINQGERDLLGVFCVSVDSGAVETYRHDDYMSLLAQTVSDRLAEATAERLHLEVRRHLWGYAKDETLTIPQLFHCDYQGIRPASGYPSMPDTSVNFLINELLDMSQIGIRLTETGMMQPHSSICGFMFAHPQARYFDLGKIGEDQLGDYARRRGLPLPLVRKFLQSSLMKK